MNNESTDFERTIIYNALELNKVIQLQKGFVNDYFVTYSRIGIVVPTGSTMSHGKQQ